MTEKRWRCDGCRKVSSDSELLTAPNPFNPDDTLTGCPHCFACDQFDMLCSTPGCNLLATCGGPGADGAYRQTCGDHAYWVRKG